MSESLFQCPPPAALPVIPQQTCGVRFEQIVRLAFQRKQSIPSFTSETIKDQAAWTPLIASGGNDRIVLSPFINNPLLPPGEALTEGGNDNTTIGGVSRLLGEGFQQATFELRNAGKEVREAIRQLTSETAIVPGLTNLVVYMINRFGEVIANADGSGIPIYNFFVGSPGTEGFNRDNMQMGKFDLKPGWDANVVVHKPDFNPLDLVAPATELGSVGTLQVSDEAGTSLRLTWAAVAGASGYTIQRATNASFTSGLTTTTVNAPTVTALISGLSIGTQYYFRVKPTATGAADGPWVTASVTTEGRIATPTVTISGITASAATVNWNDVNGGEINYRVQVTEDPSWSGVVMTQTVGANTITANFSGLTANTQHYVRVTALAAEGALNSLPGEATFTTLP